jgi:peroxiredoxin
MMNATKLDAGASFPKFETPKFGGGTLTVGAPAGDNDWQLVIVYRGKHCPICTRYLNTLNELLPKFNELGVDVIAVSGDTQERAEVQLADVNPAFAVGYDMSIAQMKSLGLYISDPRSEAESDRPFPEPGLFMINDKGNIQIIDISNAPFARPDLNVVLGGTGFVRNPENNYPVRGMHT